MIVWIARAQLLGAAGTLRRIRDAVEGELQVVEAGVLDRDGELAGERLQGLDVARVEDVRLGVLDVDDTEDLPAVLHGHRQLRPGEGEAGLGHEQRIGLRVRDGDRLAAARRRPRDPLPELQPEPERRPAREVAAARDEGEAAVLDEEETRRVASRQLAHRLHDETRELGLGGECRQQPRGARDRLELRGEAARRSGWRLRLRAVAHRRQAFALTRRSVLEDVQTISSCLATISAANATCGFASTDGARRSADARPALRRQGPCES